MREICVGLLVAFAVPQVALAAIHNAANLTDEMTASSKARSESKGVIFTNALRVQNNVPPSKLRELGQALYADVVSKTCAIKGNHIGLIVACLTRSCMTASTGTATREFAVEKESLHPEVIAAMRIAMRKSDLLSSDSRAGAAISPRGLPVLDGWQLSRGRAAEGLGSPTRCSSDAIRTPCSASITDHVRLTPADGALLRPIIWSSK